MLCLGAPSSFDRKRDRDFHALSILWTRICGLSCTTLPTSLSSIPTSSTRYLIVGFRDCSTLYEKNEGAAEIICPMRVFGTPMLSRKVT
uniref:Uncharacterized protein n=1 Tax=Arundo donax TaxID=35708 RepID=A0A0A9DLP7_ARUDO